MRVHLLKDLVSPAAAAHEDENRRGSDFALEKDMRKIGDNYSMPTNATKGKIQLLIRLTLAQRGKKLKLSPRSTRRK